METFINNLRRSLNHLSDADHAALHKIIRDAAHRHFADVKDSQIEEWLSTEDFHAEDFNRTDVPNPDPELADFMMSKEDLRADTDRFLFATIHYIQEDKKTYAERLEKFRADVEPRLSELTLTPDFTIDTLDRMPIDATYLLHAFLGRQIAKYEPIIRRQKVLPTNILISYLNSTHQVRQYYGFGGKLLADAIKTSNRDLKGIQSYLSEYLSKARVKTSSRYVNSQPLLQTIDFILSGL